MGTHEKLEAVATLQQIAEAKQEKWWHRAPFVWTVATFVLSVVAGASIWIGSLQARISSDETRIGVLETFKHDLEHDKEVGIVEQVHTNTKAVERNTKQIQTINKEIWHVPDP
jgi:hypothetical protein